MTDADPSPTADWLDAQRRYWDAWLDLSRRTMHTGSPTISPWADALDHWWRSASPGLPPDARSFLDHVMEMGRGYFGMAERLMRAGGGPEGATEAFKAWMDQMSDTLGTTGAGTGNPGGSKDTTAFWQLPLDTWQRVASAFSPFPGDLMNALRPEGAAAFGDGMREHLDRFLSIPGVGYSRESQARHQDFLRRLLDYQRACQVYEAGLSRVAVDSLDRFRARLDHLARHGQAIGSLRELFNEWVDVCEEVYGEYALSDEYARLYGELVNALMAVKQEGAKLVDETLEAMNMPTRREVCTLQQRLQETRREMQRLRARLDALAPDENAPREKPVPEASLAASSASATKRKSTSGRKTAKARPRTGRS